jgi:hypothetical protein
VLRIGHILILLFVTFSTFADVKLIGETAYYTGSISEERNRKFFDVINNQSVKRLVFNSTGGEVEAAINLGLWIYQNKIDIEITEYCFSSCANYIFPAAYHKIIRAGAIVAWHGNYHHLKNTGLWKDDVTIRMKKYDEDAATAERNVLKKVDYLVGLEKDFFNRISVDEYLCWFGKMPPFNVPDYYYLSKQDMVHFGITHINVHSNYEKTDLSSFKYHVWYINRISGSDSN